MRAAAVGLAVLTLIGCRPTPDAEAGATDEATQTAPVVEEAPTYDVTIDDLRADHPVDNEGATCQIDDDCDSPLRCMDFMCQFPPAMTGTPHASLVDATFVTEDGPVTFHLELADTPPEQMRGLMHRRVMAPDYGMIFDFRRDRMQSFWMRNTLIHLDMVFVRNDGVVDSIQAMAEPLTETSRRSEGPARFVIELVGGTAERVGIVPGTRVEVPGYIDPAP